MKRLHYLTIILFLPLTTFAQNEVGPDGDKLFLILVVLLVLILVYFFFLKRKGKNTPGFKFGLPGTIKIQLDKDTLYYPDNLTLKIKNTRNTDVDLDKPLLVFDNFWLKRKFKLKGMGNRIFYPLYLEKGKTHKLEIDLTQFYAHDKSLKKYPKAKVIVTDVKGKKLGSKSVYLRKTLFKF